MRDLLVFILICLFSIPCPAQAQFKILQNKNGGQTILNSLKTSRKSFESVKTMLEKSPNDKALLNLAMEYSITEKSWADAIFYTDQLLKFEPYSEDLLKLKGDLYCTINDFSNAVSSYEVLIANYPKPEYQLELANLYMLDQNCSQAQVVIEPANLVVKNKLDQSDLGFKNINNSNLLEEDVEKNPNLLGTESGYEGLDMTKSRVVFYDLLNINPNYVPTKAGLTRSYIGTTHDLFNLEQLDKMPLNDKTKLLRAQTYYDMNMWSDAKDAIKGVSTKEAEVLKYKIRRDEAITLTPTYSFFFQQLAEEFDLDIHQFGTRLSKNVDNNKNIFMEYNVLTYTSGQVKETGNRLTNVVNEFKGGVRSRVNEKWEYRGDIGVKVFEFGNGAMILTDSWIKHYFNDKFNLKLGFRRDNIEQSYLSAVGRLVNGVFTGRAADNKLYVEFNGLLPHKLYAFGFGSCGVIDAQNLPTNQYSEGLIGLGRLLYNNPKNKWINTFGVDVVSYNSSYQFNLLRVPNGTGQVFGGYFSPSYFNATTFNVRAEGAMKNNRLRYGIDAFGGLQTAMSPDMTLPAWGVAPYIAYDINDNVSINLSYDHYEYAAVQRDQFIINAVIRGFDRHAKN